MVPGVDQCRHFHRLRRFDPDESLLLHRGAVDDCGHYPHRGSPVGRGHLVPGRQRAEEKGRSRRERLRRKPAGIKIMKGRERNVLCFFCVV